MTIAEDFAAWWAHCPLKVGKLAAEREYIKVRARGVSQEELILAMDAYVRKKPPHISYCHPRTWLHQGRWMDEYDEAHVRAGWFCRWYAETHERHFGVRYVGSRSDFDAASPLALSIDLLWLALVDAHFHAAHVLILQ